MEEDDEFPVFVHLLTKFFDAWVVFDHEPALDDFVICRLQDYRRVVHLALLRRAIAAWILLDESDWGTWLVQ